MNNSDKAISSLMKSFIHDDVLLYIGSGFDVDKASKEFYSYPWSVVISTNTSSVLIEKFANESRKIQSYTKLEGNNFNLFDKNNLKIIQVMGRDGYVEGYEEIPDDIREEYIKDEAVSTISKVISRMDVRSKLVVVGYNPENRLDISISKMYSCLTKISNGMVAFYGMLQNEMVDHIKELAISRGYEWYEEEIDEFIKEQSDIDFEFGEDKSDDELYYTYYRSGKLAKINKNLILRAGNFLKLLNNEDIYAIRPYGRLQQSRWFYNFLSKSADSPQWYGYLPQSDFYLKRDIEDALVYLVKNLMESNELRIKEVNTPVILCGDPSSSKSILLGALAFRIFSEQVFPVVYLNNPNLDFSNESSELTQLDEILDSIRQGDNNPKFLIIWDGSSYRNVLREANNLKRTLENRGYRFVLVCTAYDILPKMDSNYDAISYGYDSIDNSFKKKEAEQNIYLSNNFYYVPTSRFLSEKEKINLKQKIKLYTGIDNAELDSIWGDDIGDDIFDHMYKLMYILRPKFEKGLTREQRIVNDYVKKQLSLLVGKEENVAESEVVIALREAGIDVEDINDDIHGKIDTYDIEKFASTIAFYSKFKLQTPYSFAIKMLSGKDNKRIDHELYMILSNDIPYINTKTDINNRIVFEFRNTKEAELYLEKNGINVEEQLEIFCKTIEYYGQLYVEDGEIYTDLKYLINDTIRMIGPNPRYIPYKQGGEKEAEHKSIMRQYDKIISSLESLRKTYNVPDDDMSLRVTEVTMSREYYGNLWKIIHNENNKEDFSKRYKRLDEAINLSIENINTIDSKIDSFLKLYEKTRYFEKKYSLSVECVLCCREIDRLRSDFKELYDYDIGNLINKEENHDLSYGFQYDMLKEAIDYSPYNGYAYNALFYLFEKEYEKSNAEEKIKLLSNVRMYVDDASQLDITNRGMDDRDELSTHINKIIQYSSSHRVTIAQIKNRTAVPEFLKIYDSMLEQRNASSICFICEQELDGCGLSGRDVQKNSDIEFILNEEQINICKLVLDFMRDDERYECVLNSNYAIFLMIRVAWMYYNKRPINYKIERCKTYISEDGWKFLNELCEMYIANEKIFQKPVVKLIYAMCKIHISDDYKKCYNIIKGIKESDFYNEKRMWVPYIICDKDGNPYKYSGIVKSTKLYNGFMTINGYKISDRSNKDVRFTQRTLGLKEMPKENDLISDIELGIGYVGFTAYKYEEVRSV